MIKFLTNLFGFDYPISKENTMTARIAGTNDQFALLTKSGTVIATYSRARDARRGAERRGLTLVG